MNRALPAIAFLCAVGGLSYWLLRTDGTMTAQAPGERILAPTPRNFTALRNEGPLPEFGTAEFKSIARRRVEKWVDTRGRDATSLVAAWDITGDASLLDEAAEKFPDDPRVCMAMISRTDDNAKDTLGWIQRLIAAEPSNPQGYYLKTWALMNSKDQAGALTSVRSALDAKGKRDAHLRGRMMTAREAALAIGAGIRDASELALGAPLYNGAYYPWMGLMKLLRAEIADAGASGDSERLIAATGLGLGAALHLRSTQAPLLADLAGSHTIQESMLNALPDDTEYGTTGQTVAERREALRAEKEIVKEVMRQHDGLEALMSRATDAQVSEYTDRFLLYGEQTAVSWLFNQIPQ